MLHFCLPPLPHKIVTCSKNALQVVMASAPLLGMVDVARSSRVLAPAALVLRQQAK